MMAMEARTARRFGELTLMTSVPLLALLASGCGTATKSRPTGRGESSPAPQAATANSDLVVPSAAAVADTPVALTRTDGSRARVTAPSRVPATPTSASLSDVSDASDDRPGARAVPDTGRAPAARVPGPAPPGKVLHADTTSFPTLVLGAESPVLVDFYADWCGPCRMLAPVLEQVARETPTARIVKVNIDKNPELARQYRVSAIPTMIVFQDGRPVAEHNGLADKERVRQLLQR